MKNKTQILITPKISPDLDGLACVYAYTKLLGSIDRDNQYSAGVYGQPQIEAQFLLDKFNITDTLNFNPKINFDKFILVDASDLTGMPEIIRPQDVIEVVDHRLTHQAHDLFANAKIEIEVLGAAATLIFEKFQEGKIEVDYNSAILLYGAIFSNTLNFQIDIVSPRDREAVRFLKEKFAFPDGIIDEMFDYKTNYLKDNLTAVIRSDFKVFDLGLSNRRIGVAQIEGFNLMDVFVAGREEISSVLKILQKEKSLDLIFLTMADIKNGFNIIFVIDNDSKVFLEEKMKLKFVDNLAQTDKLLLRKQILPILIN
jgi:inorganic pyrophosphatase/exopolyphosphatase